MKSYETAIPRAMHIAGEPLTHNETEMMMLHEAIRTLNPVPTEPVRDEEHRKLSLLAKHAMMEGWQGPFVVNEYMALPGDVRAFVAQEQMRGICCAGRESRELAEHDAQGLNAAFRFGLDVGEHKAHNR